MTELKTLSNKLDVIKGLKDKIQYDYDFDKVTHIVRSIKQMLKDSNFCDSLSLEETQILMEEIDLFGWSTLHWIFIVITEHMVDTSIEYLESKIIIESDEIN